MITSTFSCVRSTASASLRLLSPPCHEVEDNVPAFDVPVVTQALEQSRRTSPAVNTPILYTLAGCGCPRPTRPRAGQGWRSPRSL